MRASECGKETEASKNIKEEYFQNECKWAFSKIQLKNVYYT